jgi:hypothetical protein
VLLLLLLLLNVQTLMLPRRLIPLSQPLLPLLQLAAVV